jgi:hypothetical protein
MTRIPSLLRLSIPAAALLACAGLTSSVSAQSTSGGAGRRAPSQNARAGGRTRSGQRSPVVVRARAGETLTSLSARFGVSVDDLAHANNIKEDARLLPGQQILIPLGSTAGTSPIAPTPPPAATLVEETDANRLRMVDGQVVEFDEAWEDSRGLWYRKGGVVNLVERGRVASVERRSKQAEGDVAKPKPSETKAKIVEVNADGRKPSEPVWIYLVGGARVEADEVSETETGAWYRRGGLSIFLERARIERIERERPTQTREETPAVAGGAWIERGWTTGNQNLDEMIRAGGKRHGVDPYLIFCVMEQESHFNPRALSPKGARGLMQLMPGTAARFGVRNSFDPQQNIMGGTLYLKQLLEQFGGRVDLVLASYNAGEGAVLKYGGNVPPYRETRDYVRRIGARYGQPNSLVQATAMTTPKTPQQK